MFNHRDDQGLQKHKHWAPLFCEKSSLNIFMYLFTFGSCYFAVNGNLPLESLLP